MKYLLFVSAIILLTLSSPAQTILFHEDFEAPGYDSLSVSGDSLNSSSNPTTGINWFRNDSLHSQGNSCIHRQVAAGQTLYLTTIRFYTLGYNTIKLNFSQICKTNFLDIATIEASPDGITWIQLTGAHYTGVGQYATNGNRFASNSYGNLWLPSNSTAIPNNTWWREESFNLSSVISNTDEAYVRFKLKDDGPSGSGNNFGWCIDNIIIEGNGITDVIGTITWDTTLIGINYAQVILMNSNIVVAIDTTSIFGHYQFTNCPPGFYTVHVSCNLPGGGFNAADGMAILKHFTGVALLTGLHLDAADVSGDHVVNSLDALMILKRFVGMINTFPAGEWVFEMGSFTLPQINTTVVDLKGLSYGDVNASYLIIP